MVYERGDDCQRWKQAERVWKDAPKRIVSINTTSVSQRYLYRYEKCLRFTVWPTGRLNNNSSGPHTRPWREGGRTAINPDCCGAKRGLRPCTVVLQYRHQLISEFICLLGQAFVTRRTSQQHIPDRWLQSKSINTTRPINRRSFRYASSRGRKGTEISPDSVYVRRFYRPFMFICWMCERSKQ